MRDISAVCACLGAIIGAGFASGREIMAFFTCYGAYSWWLILVSAGVMTWLCRLCMRWSNGAGWLRIFGNAWTLRVSCCLMVITGGAMIAAARHVCVLVFPGKFAGTACAAGTLITAWMISRRNLKAMGWISAALSILLMCVLISTFRLPGRTVLLPANAITAGSLVRAGVYAAAYAAMNAMLASGVICRCIGKKQYTAAGVGGGFAVLLGISNALYLRHPELLNTALPLVELLRAGGRNGFLISAGLMYLSVLTTLTAVLCALKPAVERVVHSPVVCAVLAMGLPLLVSFVGFSGIVDALYAPAGLLCLIAVFLPLQWKLAKQSNT